MQKTGDRVTDHITDRFSMVATGIGVIFTIKTTTKTIFVLDTDAV